MILILNKKELNDVKSHIAGIVMERGEGLLDDHGVDPKAANELAGEITEFLKKKYNFGGQKA
jgi:hypothetical protein